MPEGAQGSDTHAAVHKEDRVESSHGRISLGSSLCKKDLLFLSLVNRGSREILAHSLL